MKSFAHEGYFKDGLFYKSGKKFLLPDKSKVIITILEDEQNIDITEQEVLLKSQKRNFDFVTDAPPLPDSFFDPLPDEELDLWSLLDILW